MIGEAEGSVTVKGLHYETGAPVEIIVEGGCVAAVRELVGGGLCADGEGDELWLGPGLVDLQINGYGGEDINSPACDAALVGRLTRALWQEGVTSWCPTVITDSPQRIERKLRAIAEACRTDVVTNSCIAGIHLEGPFLSPEDGPRGAHDAAWIRPPDWWLLEAWQHAAEGRIRLLTLSPEWPEAPELIRRCVEHGIAVSIGHTAATPEQIAAAVAAGASMSTHIGNGAHLTLPRHPNYLWEQLAADELHACVIADGFHLPDAVLKVVIRTKGEKALLVSDAVYLSGMPPGDYTTHIGGQVTLTAEGRLHLRGEPRLLAGSAQMLPWGIAHLAGRGISSWGDAWAMASTRPAALLRLAAASGLQAGAPADFVAYRRSEEGRIAIAATYKMGRRVFESAPAL